MAKKELRTVKTSSETGRLNREAVRSAVIKIRDGRSPGTTKSPYAGSTSSASTKR